MSDFFRPGNHILGAGVVYFDTGEGERPIIDTDQLTLVVEVGTIERWSSVGGPAQVADSQVVRVRRTLSFGTHDIRADNLRDFFGADELAALDVGSSYTAATTRAGYWYQCTELPAPFAVTSITFAAAAAPVEGTHYRLDTTRGRVEVLVDGLGQLDVTFTADTVNALDLQPISDVRGSMRFIADPKAGAGVDLWFPSVVLRPSDQVGWKSNTDWTRLAWEAEVIGEPRSSAARSTMAIVTGEGASYPAPTSSNHAINEYADLAAMQAAITAGDIADGAVAYVTSEAGYYLVSGGAPVEVGAGGGQTAGGMTAGAALAGTIATFPRTSGTSGDAPALDRTIGSLI